jgi:hypothetical protein
MLPHSILARRDFNPNNSTLGGKVTPNSRVVMTVKSSKPVYLRGSVKHTYNGTNWTSEEMTAYKTNSGNNFDFQVLGYKKTKQTIYATSLYQIEILHLPLYLALCSLFQLI